MVVDLSFRETKELIRASFIFGVLFIHMVFKEKLTVVVDWAKGIEQTALWQIVRKMSGVSQYYRVIVVTRLRYYDLLGSGLVELRF